MPIGTLTPESIFDHTLDVQQGTGVQYEAITAADGTTLVTGRVGSLDASGNVVLGLSSDTAMPLFIAQTESKSHIGNIMSDAAYAIVGAATVEIMTTEYDNEVAYPPNQPCTVVNSGDDIGKITTGVMYTDPIVLIVSRGIQTKGEGTGSSVPVLCGWTVYIPPVGSSSS